jgi:Flp pilus assembly protein TadG
MQRFIHNVIQLLDGTPAVYGKRQSGQSLVEMALITPILIIMLMGMVEIGWFANNYLTLLDVARAGARRAAVLQEQFSPLEWDNTASYARVIDVGANDYTRQGLALSGSSQLTMPNIYPVDPNNQSVTTDSTAFRNNQRLCENTNRQFYLELTCVMLASMSPLVLNPNNNIDDIVISGFSIARITSPQGSPAFNVLGPDVRPGGATAQTHMVVVGRYPTNANECDVAVTNASTAPVFSVVPEGDARRANANGPFENRDPFDINQNGQRDVRAIDNNNVALGNGLFTEPAGYDPVVSTLANAEKAVGFSLTGQRWIPNTGCLGSNFTVRRVEQLINLPSFQMTDEERRSRLPHQGIVLVELFWEHSMLLRFPVFNPVVAAFAGDINPPVSVWAIFPLPQVEPSNATLGLPNN